MMTLCTGGSHKANRFPYQMTWSRMQVISWFMVLVPEGMLSVTQQVPDFESLEGSGNKLLELHQQGLEIHQCVQSCLHLVNGWEWHDPVALPTAHKITEHLMISALFKFFCFATTTVLEGKVRVCFFEWHSPCWAQISLLWWSVTLHSLCPWLAEAPR